MFAWGTEGLRGGGWRAPLRETERVRDARLRCAAQPPSALAVYVAPPSVSCREFCELDATLRVLRRCRAPVPCLLCWWAGVGERPWRAHGRYATGRRGGATDPCLLTVDLTAISQCTLEQVRLPSLSDHIIAWRDLLFNTICSKYSFLRCLFYKLGLTNRSNVAFCSLIQWVVVSINALWNNVVDE